MSPVETFTKAPPQCGPLKIGQLTNDELNQYFEEVSIYKMYILILFVVLSLKSIYILSYQGVYMTNL